MPITLAATESIRDFAAWCLAMRAGLTFLCLVEELQNNVELDLRKLPAQLGPGPDFFHGPLLADYSGTKRGHLKARQHLDPLRCYRRPLFVAEGGERNGAAGPLDVIAQRYHGAVFIHADRHFPLQLWDGEALLRRF